MLTYLTPLRKLFLSWQR